jgi:hypothetical protein
MRLEGKNLIVVGGSSGIGLETPGLRVWSKLRSRGPGYAAWLSPRSVVVAPVK